MTSIRQIEANRRNALRSTGPKTDEGKRQSRRNAVRHGLTAETVVVSLEDVEDYRAFEAAIIADYDARTAVERELVLRLASLLWRLRRATGIETDLLQIQAEILRDRQTRDVTETAPVEPQNTEQRAPGASFRPTLVGQPEDASDDSDHDSLDDQHDDLAATPDPSVGQSRVLTYCFMRLVNFDSRVLKRLSRYEAALWRQTVQTLFALRHAWRRQNE
jgi:hypothetical protein